MTLSKSWKPLLLMLKERMFICIGWLCEPILLFFIFIFNFEQ